MSRVVASRTWQVLPLALALGCSGGPGIYPVEGVVVYPDGSPAKELSGYTVEFESLQRLDGKLLSAVGSIAADGTFTLTTNRPGDGALTGEHRILISPPVLNSDGPAPPRLIDPKYCAFETSGLTATVAPSKNKVELKIERKKR